MGFEPTVPVIKFVVKDCTQYRLICLIKVQLEVHYNGPSSYDRPDIPATWVTTKVLSYDQNAGQGQNVYPLLRL
jgi:hypothetical protein